jgi:DNA-binding transcriptional LysR family regulator
LARLLHRTTRTVTVSAEGTLFYVAAVRILDDVDAAGEALRAQSAAPAGRLRVSVPTSFALRWLAPRLAAFIEAYASVELDLVLNDRYVDIVHEGFDCAIRIAARLPDSTPIARPLGAVQRLLVAAPRYLEGAPPLGKPQDIASHACLGYSQDGGRVEWPLRDTPGGRPLVVNGICRVNNSVMLRELLVAGLGVTLTPEFVVTDLLRDGSLVELLPRCRPAPLTVWGVVAHPRHVAHKVNVFLEFVRQQMSAKGRGSKVPSRQPRMTGPIA